MIALIAAFINVIIFLGAAADVASIALEDGAYGLAIAGAVPAVIALAGVLTFSQWNKSKRGPVAFSTTSSVLGFASIVITWKLDANAVIMLTAATVASILPILMFRFLGSARGFSAPAVVDDVFGGFEVVDSFNNAVCVDIDDNRVWVSSSRTRIPFNHPSILGLINSIQSHENLNGQGRHNATQPLAVVVSNSVFNDADEHAYLRSWAWSWIPGRFSKVKPRPRAWIEFASVDAAVAYFRQE